MVPALLPGSNIAIIFLRLLITFTGAKAIKKMIAMLLMPLNGPTHSRQNEEASTEMISMWQSRSSRDGSQASSFKIHAVVPIGTSDLISNARYWTIVRRSGYVHNYQRRRRGQLPRFVWPATRQSGWYLSALIKRPRVFV